MEEVGHARSDHSLLCCTLITPVEMIATQDGSRISPTGRERMKSAEYSPTYSSSQMDFRNALPNTAEADELQRGRN